jgi:hypothetical protein
VGDWIATHLDQVPPDEPRTTRWTRRPTIVASSWRFSPSSTTLGIASHLEAPDRPIQVVTAEDSILLKLEWYRLGGEISDLLADARRVSRI